LADIIPALTDCLEALDKGGDALEARLRRHEGHRQELIALLGIVKELQAMGQEEEAVPSDEFINDLKARLLRGGDEG